MLMRLNSDIHSLAKVFYWGLFGGLFTIMLASTSVAATRIELLEPEMAFQFSASLDETNAKNLLVNFKIADGYYMYRNKLKFSLEPASIKLGKPVLPQGKVKKDKIFGKIETYRHQLSIKLPLAKSLTEPVYLTVVSQGCADVGVCYQPMKNRIRLSSKPDATIEAGDQPLSAILKRAPPRPTEPL